ncbi:MAG: S-adenosyl-l-methionine hydroxide adenosyltransferase family protein [Euryarchaeota archaeon]|nr:S-adenosyl-l-methionine hydroxide adenosyltransferase family protein [Euryarchaeota archaeon]
MSIITLTTDFDNLYPASMKARILSIEPTASIVDITHSIPPADILSGAFALYSTAPLFPAGTVHVAVVDPGVGTTRRAIVIEVCGQYLVGPDNGLLIPAARRMGDFATYQITNMEPLGEISHTFHGRDIFAPIGAHLSAGMSIEDIGKVIDDPVEPDNWKVVAEEDRISGTVLYIDHFGNIITSIPQQMVREFAGYGEKIQAFGKTMPLLGTYANIRQGDLLALIASHGFLEISVNQGSAADRLGVKGHPEVEVRKI